METPEPAARPVRRLVVVRHAKAEDTAPTDHERRLEERGRADARTTGRWLAEHAVVPDRALVSSAARTRDTWAALAEGGGWDLGPSGPSVDEGLYAAGTDTVLDLVRATPAEVRTLVVVGHNPTMGSLAQLLDDGEGDDEAGTQLAVRGFPTSAAAVFEVPDWSEVAEVTGRLVAFHVGRG